MAGRRQSEIEKIQGRLTVTQALWDYERERILRALGFDEDINPRAWPTEALVEEIKDMLMIRPHFCSSIPGSSSCVKLNGPFRFD